MFQFTLSPNTATELEAMIEVLERKGLLSQTKVTSRAPSPSPEVDEHKIAIQKRIKQLGFKVTPRPSYEEKELRTQIDARQIETGLPPIDWQDFLARELALREVGYIFTEKEAPEKEQEEPEPGEKFEGEIDLENPPVH